jgi:hypothetical protein
MARAWKRSSPFDPHAQAARFCTLPGHFFALVLVSAVACVGTTGGDVIDFPAAAAGPIDAATLRANGFDTSLGWHVVLTKAVLHVGAAYLSQAQPVSGAQATNCILPGTYVAQITTGLDVDLLSSEPAPFPSLGHGTTLEALVGQVWLSGGADDRDLDNPDDTTPIVVLAGTAERLADTRSFSASITIASNRAPQGGSFAGGSTLCKQRVVSPIPLHVTVQHVGGLLLRIDPRQLFVNVDFSKLGKSSNGYVFSDDPTQLDPSSPFYYSQPSANLYQNLRSASPTAPLYSFTWDPSLR